MVKKKTNKKKKPIESKQVKSLKKEIDLLKQDFSESKEKNVRLLAEFDNYKRRINERMTEKEKYEGINLIKEIINIVDDFDRMLSVKSIIKEKSIHEGILLIKNKFINTLNEYGVKTYESIGNEFNTDMHEAVMMKKSKNKSNIVLEEYQVGYIYHDKVVRHAKVIVGEWKETIMRY